MTEEYLKKQIAILFLISRSLEKHIKEPKRLFRASVVLLLRILIIACAEAKGLFSFGKAAYDSDYSLLAHYFARSKPKFSTSFSFLRLIKLSELIKNNSNTIGFFLPHFNGEIFDNSFLFLEPDNLKNVLFDDKILFATIEALSDFQLSDEALLKYFSDYEIHKIGFIYEYLIDYSLCTAEDYVLDWAQAEVDSLIAEHKPLKEISELFSKQKPFLLFSSSHRRKTGTHYTPLSLAQKIIKTTLKPIVYRASEKSENNEMLVVITPDEILNLKICDIASGTGVFLIEVCQYLGEKLIESIRFHINELSSKIHKLYYEIINEKDSQKQLKSACRLIAQNCLYGVDTDALAVELAKISLWLFVASPENPIRQMFFKIKSGDSLVGLLSYDELFESLKLDHKKKQRIKLHLSEVTSVVSKVIANTAIALRLCPSASKKLKELLNDFLLQLDLPQSAAKKNDKLFFDLKAELYNHLCAFSDISLNAFHWIISFPEVFDAGGFDAIVGNPPFLGGHYIAASMGKSYKKYLIDNYSKSGGLADYCVYFFLRSFRLLKPRGFLGLIATNSIGQGNTRITGLETLLKQGALIYNADTTVKWEGKASLAVSLVHITKNNNYNADVFLNSKKVARISSSLNEALHRLDRPKRLKQNLGLCFTGPETLGKGFFVDSDIAQELLKANPDYSRVLRPYITGEDIVSKSQIVTKRWVINFDDMPLSRSKESSWYLISQAEQEKMLKDGLVSYDYPFEVAEDYSLLLKQIKEKVKPVREFANNKKAKKYWWRFASNAIKMKHRIANLKQVIICSLTSKYFAFDVVEPDKYEFSILVKVFALDEWADFALMSSIVHNLWAKEFCSTLEDRLRYTSTEIFDTFVFPKKSKKLNQLGKEYYFERQKIMLKDNIGLTDFYNGLHNSFLKDSRFKKMRSLKVELDKETLFQYGWQDLKLNYDFFKTAQGIRFTIADKQARILLSRLFELNFKS